CGSVPNMTTCSPPGPGRSTPAILIPRFRSWPASRPARSRPGYPLLLDGEAALELPGAAEHPGYPLALAVSARFASNRADVTGTEELCRRAAEANERRDPPDWRVEEVICGARANIAVTAGAFADAARLSEQAAGLARAGGDLADTSLELGIATSGYLLVGDAPTAVPLAREALTLARQIGDPALIATALLEVARPSPRPTPNRPAPTYARVSSSARRSAIKAPSTWSGPPGSHFL
ncbi:MAG: hypothetical protein ACRDPL_06285, partial [Propionibacteriaceae bacterium]